VIYGDQVKEVLDCRRKRIARS